MCKNKQKMNLNHFLAKYIIDGTDIVMRFKIGNGIIQVNMVMEV